MQLTVVFWSTPWALISEKLTFPLGSRVHGAVLRCPSVSVRCAGGVVGTRGMGGGTGGSIPGAAPWYGSGWPPPLFPTVTTTVATVHPLYHHCGQYRPNCIRHCGQYRPHCIRHCNHHCGHCTPPGTPLWPLYTTGYSTVASQATTAGLSLWRFARSVDWVSQRLWVRHFD